MTASMENVVSVTERVKSSAQLFFLCMALVAILFSIMSAHFLVRPFKRLLRSFDRVAQGIWMQISAKMLTVRPGRCPRQCRSLFAS